jgi:hypothetical protein
MRVRAMQYPFVCPGDSGEKNIAVAAIIGGPDKANEEFLWR